MESFNPQIKALNLKKWDLGPKPEALSPKRAGSKRTVHESEHRNKNSKVKILREEKINKQPKNLNRWRHRNF